VAGMKTILVPVEQHAFMRSVLVAALSVAGRFGSHVEGVALGPDIPEIIGFDVPATWALLDQKSQRDLADRSRQVFEEFMREHQVPGTGAPSEVSYGWAGRQLVGDSYVGSHGRAFDLLVLGKPEPRDEPPRMSTLEAALFESGRPVLLVPREPPAAIGDTVVIAWNRSTETARAVAFAMPILAQARSVVVLTVEDWGVEGPSGEELAKNLRRNGISAEVVARGSKARSPGEAILEYATGLKADVLVKGAYTQSRLRQMFFGGATSHVLAKAKLPVLMAH
jgi:nucleotide-binding universal stress UspA family protein